MPCRVHAWGLSCEHVCVRGRGGWVVVEGGGAACATRLARCPLSTRSPFSQVQRGIVGLSRTGKRNVAELRGAYVRYRLKHIDLNTKAGQAEHKRFAFSMGHSRDTQHDHYNDQQANARDAAKFINDT